MADFLGYSSIAYCAEQWGAYKKGRLYYSIFSLLVQFLLPLTLITLAHRDVQNEIVSMSVSQENLSNNLQLYC